MIAIGHNPEGRTVSDIQSLTQTVRDLSQRVDLWNQLMLWGLGFTVIAALFVLVATRMVVFRSGQLSSAQELLSAAKDRQLQDDLKAKDIEIGNLKIRSDTAESGIATAQVVAAKANLLAEQEKLARVKIEEGIAWRRMGKETRTAFGLKFLPFSRQRSGIAYNPNDVEASGFATDLALALHDVAKWNISEPQPVMKMREGPVPVGTNPPLERGITVVTTADEESRHRAGLLAKELTALGFDSVVSGDIDRRSTIPTIYIWVEPRPEGPQGEAKLRAQKEHKQINPN
jgi:hypothetical protein